MCPCLTGVTCLGPEGPPAWPRGHTGLWHRPPPHPGSQAAASPPPPWRGGAGPPTHMRKAVSHRRREHPAIQTLCPPPPHTSRPPALSPPPTQPPTLFPPYLPSQGGLLPPQTHCPDTADAFLSCPHQDPRGCLWLLVTFLQGDEAPSHTVTEKQQGGPSQVRPGLATQRCQSDGRCLLCSLWVAGRARHPVPAQIGAQSHGAPAGTLSGPTGLRAGGHRADPHPLHSPLPLPSPPGSSAATASGAGPLPTCTSYSMCNGTRTSTWGW